LLQAIITDPRLSPTAKVVAGALLDCLNWQTGRCYPSLAHLAKRVGKKRGVISAAICRLIECGFSVREGVEHRATALPLFARRCAEKWKQWR
jgi:hypothetical protein